MSDQPTHPLLTSADAADASHSVTEAHTVPRKITPCAMLTTGFGTLSALRITENGKVSYQIAATCRFDVAKANSVHRDNTEIFVTTFGRMNVRGGVMVSDVVSGEDPDAVCMLNEDYDTFDYMWANYETLVTTYMDLNQDWIKAQNAEKQTKEKGA